MPGTRFAAFADLSPDDELQLRRMAGPIRILAPSADLRENFKNWTGVFVLHEGMVASTCDLSNGDRQMVKLHLPGDILGAPSLPFTSPVETLTAVTVCRVSHVSAHAMGRVFSSAPRLAMLFFLAAQQERAALMDKLTAVGQLKAKQSMAAFLIDLDRRIGRDGDSGTREFTLPLSQRRIGELLGLSVIHTNRVLQELERSGVIARTNRTFHLLKREELRLLAALPERNLVRNPDWLPT